MEPAGVESHPWLLWPARLGRRPSEIFAEQTAIEASSLQSEDSLLATTEEKEEANGKWEEVLGGGEECTTGPSHR